jgi:hypothetical protein
MHPRVDEEEDAIVEELEEGTQLEMFEVDFSFLNPTQTTVVVKAINMNEAQEKVFNRFGTELPSFFISEIRSLTNQETRNFLN